MRTGQDRPGQDRKYLGAGKNDEEYASDYRDWIGEDEREHLERLADRNVREGYDR
jgi:hypothetical protein